MQDDPDKVSDMKHEGQRLLLLKQAMENGDRDGLKQEMLQGDAATKNATQELETTEKRAKQEQEGNAIRNQLENSRKMKILMGITGGATGAAAKEEDDDAFLEVRSPVMRSIEERLLRGGRDSRRRKF